MRVSASPVMVPVLSVAFAVASVVGGTLLSIGGTLPISPYVTTISFLIYVICRVLGRGRTGRGWVRRASAATVLADVDRMPIDGVPASGLSGARAAGPRAEAPERPRK